MEEEIGSLNSNNQGPKYTRKPSQLNRFESTSKFEELLDFLDTDDVTSPVVLELEHLELSSSAGECISLALSENSHTRAIKLSENVLGDSGVQHLAEMLTHNSFVDELDIGENCVREEGARALGRMLHANSTLTDLNISNNSIGADGCHALLKLTHMNQHCVLRALNVSGCSLGDKGIRSVAIALKRGVQLADVRASDNHLSEDGADFLALALHNNKSLTRLDIHQNEIGNLGACEFAQMLKKNSCVRILNLRDNHIVSLKAINALFGASKHNKSLVSLDIHMTGDNEQRVLDKVFDINFEKWRSGVLRAVSHCALVNLPEEMCSSEDKCEIHNIIVDYVMESCREMLVDIPVETN
eukprot:173581_1